MERPEKLEMVELDKDTIGIPVAQFFKPEDIIRDTEDEFVVKDGELIRVIRELNGKLYTMWYPSLEVYDEQVKAANESHNNFWLKVLWGK